MCKHTPNEKYIRYLLITHVCTPLLTGNLPEIIRLPDLSYSDLNSMFYLKDLNF